MASLLCYPAELLSLVFETLKSPDLRALCLVNRDFCALVEPFLYANIKLTAQESQTPPIGSLLQSILRKSYLAGFIHDVEFIDDINFVGDSNRYNDEKPLPETYFDVAVERIKGFDVPYGDLWIQELRHGKLDASIALLLSQLSSLKCLYLDDGFTRRNSLVGMMLRSALCRGDDTHLPSFEHLQNVRIEYDELPFDNFDDNCAKNTADTLSLFYLPSVTHIRTMIDHPTTFEWPAVDPPNPSKLVSLFVSNITEDHIGRILSVTKRLQRLDWTWYRRPDNTVNLVTNVIDLDKISTSLSHVRDTLTELSIEPMGSIAPRGQLTPDISFKGPFTTFTGLHSLKKLELAYTLLMGFEQSESTVTRLRDALPRNLEHLVITENYLLFEEANLVGDAEVLWAIQVWLQDWRKYTPRFRILQLHCKLVGFERWEPRTKKELERLASEAGIEAKITQEEDE